MQTTLRGGNTQLTKPWHHRNGRVGGGTSLQGWRKDLTQALTMALLLSLPSWVSSETCQNPVNPSACPPSGASHEVLGGGEAGTCSVAAHSTPCGFGVR